MALLDYSEDQDTLPPLPPGATTVESQELPPLPPGAISEDVKIVPDPAAVAAFDRAPGVPLYQVQPGPRMRELPPLGGEPGGEGKADLGRFGAYSELGKQVGSGYSTGMAGVDRLIANIAMMLDQSSKVLPQFGVGQSDIYKHVENWARERQRGLEGQAAELAGGNQSLPAQLTRGAVSSVASLPVTAAATALGGPVGGMAALGALETADQGSVNMLKGAAESGIMGKFIHVVGPAGRMIRLPLVMGAEYVKNVAQGVAPETAMANAMNMGWLSAIGGPGQMSAKELPGHVLESLRPRLPETLPESMRFESRLNPTQEAAAAYLADQGVPLTGGQRTGNRFLTAVEATTAHTPLGAQRAREFYAGTEGALRDLAGELAGNVHNEPVTPYDAGTIVGDTLNHHIAELAGQANQAYEAAWAHAGDPAYSKRVQVRTDNKPVLDASGQPTGETERVPVYSDVNMPVDVRWMKAIAREQLPRYEYLPAAERAQSAAYSILKGVLDGEDHITAQQAEEALKGLKAEVGYDTNKHLHNVAQGTAAQMVPRLQKAIDAAVRETGQDAVIGLQEGRKLHAQKMDFADIQKKLREEPVQAFGQLTQGRDSGVNYLKEIAQRAPDALPALGRAYLDKLFDMAMSEGGWMRTDGVFKQWDNLGDQTKALLFPKEGQLQALNRFFLAQKITAERINTSGTALVKEAQDAGTNILKWLKGKYAGDILFSPKGIKFLTGIAQNPPRSSAEVTKLQQQAAEAFKGTKPPETPPEGTPPAGTPPPDGGGGPPPPSPAGGGGGASPAASMGKGPEQALAYAQEQIAAGNDVKAPDLQRRFQLGYGAAQKVLEAAGLEGGTIRSEQPNATAAEFRSPTGKEPQIPTPTPAVRGPASPRATEQELAIPTPAQSVRGATPGAAAETSVILPGTTAELKARYVVKELADLKSSHDPFSFSRNSAYPYENDRNYSTQENQFRVINQARNFNPRLHITDNPDATNGPPVVDIQGNAVGGNSRVMQLARVYSLHPEAATGYRRMLIDRAERFGADPQRVSQMKQPVLVREIAPEEVINAQRSITDLNRTGTATLSPAERALTDSHRVSPDTLQFVQHSIQKLGEDGTLAKALKSDAGPDIINRMVDDGAIPPQERSQFVSEGKLTGEGQARIQRLMIGRYFKDSAQFEGTPIEIRNKLERIAAPLTRIEQRPEFDVISKPLREALSLLEDARTRGVAKLEDLGAQSGIFGNQEYSQKAFEWARILRHNSGKALADALGKYSDLESESRPGAPVNMFAEREPLTQTQAYRESGMDDLKRAAPKRGAKNRKDATSPE